MCHAITRTSTCRSWRATCRSCASTSAAGCTCGSSGRRRSAPLADDVTELPDWASQVWIREHALAPWRADIQINPDRDGRWIFRRDPAYDFALDEITWVDTDGLRLLNPEMALAYKAKLHRPKDDADLAAALPLLDDRRRTWFYDTVARLHPDHPWLRR